MADFCLNGLSGITPADRAVPLGPDRGRGLVLDTSPAKEFAVAHWLTDGVAGGQLFVRTFNKAGNIRADFAADALASLIIRLWNGSAKG